MSDIHTLRAHLFAEISALREGKVGATVERAKAVSEIAQTIINTAKVELEFMRQTDRNITEFIPVVGAKQIKTGMVEADPVAGIVRHVMN
jgi:ribosomal protein L17